jgi:hypothetical protein
MAMIAITTRSSISVNARAIRFVVPEFITSNSLASAAGSFNAQRAQMGLMRYALCAFSGLT